ncbi:hypothetical protein FDP41_009068 [Naegleria fowleri]|uniref:Uncharacterized protein n=1 Tax=Naegleria fowleri TaxID=5763 RepID=A0A6A5BIG0_NAEFO|nr:uncharacterized protein FDP41_009068 [Naegleria fowleri]KAF0972819.1 hypothetical protein FDP41_009068 [Naegleria fowleri]CAG4718740.1 unnamed protein product [Naegleria fowleri]
MSQRFVTAYARYKDIFENNKNVLSFTATALSCVAAYLGYLSRLRHQQKLEEQLRELNQTLSKEQQATGVELLKKKTSDASMIALFMVSSALLGYSIGRFHGRRSAIKRFVTLTTNPEVTPAVSSAAGTTTSSSLSSAASSSGIAAATLNLGQKEEFAQEEPPKSTSSLDNTESSSKSSSFFKF